MNNTELVEHLMTIGGRTGMMKQIFIMNAIETHLKDVIDNGDAMIAEDDAEGRRSLIDMRSYVEAAKEVSEIMESRKELFVYVAPECPID